MGVVWLLGCGYWLSGVWGVVSLENWVNSKWRLLPRTWEDDWSAPWSWADGKGKGMAMAFKMPGMPGMPGMAGMAGMGTNPMGTNPMGTNPMGANPAGNPMAMGSGNSAWAPPAPPRPVVKPRADMPGNPAAVRKEIREADHTFDFCEMVQSSKMLKTQPKGTN